MFESAEIQTSMKRISLRSSVCSKKLRKASYQLFGKHMCEIKRAASARKGSFAAHVSFNLSFNSIPTLLRSSFYPCVFVSGVLTISEYWRYIYFSLSPFVSSFYLFFRVFMSTDIEIRISYQCLWLMCSMSSRAFFDYWLILPLSNTIALLILRCSQQKPIVIKYVVFQINVVFSWNSFKTVPFLTLTVNNICLLCPCLFPWFLLFTVFSTSS